MYKLLSFCVCALAVLTLAACGGGPIAIPIIKQPVYFDRARIDRLEIWPENPVRGSVVDIELDVHPPGGIRAQQESRYDGLQAQYYVSRGQLNYHRRVPDRLSGGWRDVEISGNSCFGPTKGFSWTLPQEPGIYTLRVEYHGLTRSLRVCIE